VPCPDHGGKQCLEWHLKKWLDQPVPKLDGYRAYAPCHPDRERSLSIGVVNGRVEIHCFACKDPVKTRAALIKAGWPRECLPLSKAAREELADQLSDILTSDLGHAAKVLACGVLVIEGGTLPKGESLLNLAARLRVSKSEAYRARHSLPKR
jgi:hypothetical protein